MKFKNNVNCSDVSRLLREKQSQAGQDLFVIAMTEGAVNGTFLEIGGHHPFEISNTYILEKMFGWKGWSIDIVDNSFSFDVFNNRIWKLFYLSVKDDSWPPVGTKFEDLPTNIQKEIISIHGYDLFVKPFLNVDQGWSIVRPNTTFIQQDATKVDYTVFPKHIDYLQIDIDTFEPQLQLIDYLTKNHEFTVITYEHEYHQGHAKSDYQRLESRRILINAGYELVVSDVSHEDKAKQRSPGDYRIFEDWWVNPKKVSSNIIDSYKWLGDIETPKYWEQILFTN